MSKPARVGEGETSRCDSCAAELPLEKLRDFSDSYGKSFEPHKDDPLNLCELCSGTFAGNATVYPAQYEGNAVVLQTICFVGNKILERLKNRG